MRLARLALCFSQSPSDVWLLTAQRSVVTRMRRTSQVETVDSGCMYGAAVYESRLVAALLSMARTECNRSSPVCQSQLSASLCDSAHLLMLLSTCAADQLLSPTPLDTHQPTSLND